MRPSSTASTDPVTTARLSGRGIASPRGRVAGSLASLVFGVLAAVSPGAAVAEAAPPAQAAEPIPVGREDAATRRLLSAAAAGRLGSVRRALEAGARIDERRPAFVGNESGQTALVVAALHGHERVVRLLLERGADPTLAEQDGFTVWHAAAFQGRARVLAVLDELAVPGDDRSPVDGYTPLHRAAWGETLRHVDAVRYLIGPGGRACDVRAANGKTPLDVAKHAQTRALLAACAASAHPVTDNASGQAPSAADPVEDR